MESPEPPSDTRRLPLAVVQRSLSRNPPTTFHRFDAFCRPAKDIRASSPDTQPPRASGPIIDLQRTSIIVRIPPCEFTGQCWSRRCSLWIGAETDQIPSILITIMRARKNDLTASMQLAAVR